jgi:hypothetical protein
MIARSSGHDLLAWPRFLSHHLDTDQFPAGPASIVVSQSLSPFACLPAATTYAAGDFQGVGQIIRGLAHD